jgi:hypothetical protein
MVELAFCSRGETPRLESMKWSEIVATFGQWLHDWGVMNLPFPLIEKDEDLDGLPDVI